MQHLGFSLKEVRELIGIRADKAHACPSVRQFLKAKLTEVTVKIRELQQLETELSLPCARRRRTDEERMKIEVLYFAGCPNHLPAMEIVRETLNSLNRQDEIQQIEIRTQAEAEAMGFVRSPSIRING
jgi:DNA-binding transcriptional MerR regulator